MKFVPAHYSPNAIHVMVGLYNLTKFFDLDLTGNDFWYFFHICYINSVGQPRTCHRLFDHSSKGDHNWDRETLEISKKLESNSSSGLRVPTAFIDGKWFA